MRGRSHRQEDGVARHRGVNHGRGVPVSGAVPVAGGRMWAVPLRRHSQPSRAQGLAMPCDSENIPLSNALSPRGLRPPSRPVNAAPFAGPLHCRSRPGVRGGDLLGGRVLVHLGAVPIALPAPRSAARFHATAGRGRGQQPRPAELWCW